MTTQEQLHAARTLDRAARVAVDTSGGAGLLRAGESTRVTATAARAAYRAHLFSDCWLCLTGRDCLTRDRLDAEASAADCAAERGRA